MRTLICLIGIAGWAQAQSPTKMYVGAWPGRILVIDEATGTYEGEIPLKTGVMRGIFLTRDHKKMIVTTVKDTGIEVVDLVGKTVISSFTLTNGNKKIRLRGTAVDP